MHLLGFIIIHRDARSFKFYIIYELRNFPSKCESLCEVTILEASQICNHFAESLLHFKRQFSKQLNTMYLV
jgi:hypothetical protein